MIPGQTWLEGMKVYGPWFPRQADNARFNFMKIDSNGTLTVTISVRHKSIEDPGDGTAFASPTIVTVATSDTAGTIKSVDVSGLKELVRFQYDAGTGVGNAWIQAMVVDATWWDTPNF